jgi:hypothetical protein
MPEMSVMDALAVVGQALAVQDMDGYYAAVVDFLAAWRKETAARGIDDQDELILLAAFEQQLEADPDFGVRYSAAVATIRGLLTLARQAQASLS